ncbi:citramalate synthase [Chlorobium ferrooxidans]|uniref:Citramalate synthase n=1 Tax=Chlorobium ferrooxidans DSM 13031 TaxID=377431 RepID=Q0YQD3_9CHLB|nr:citramalate synthase [Chlorobium ferrooxidans]EAT58494.1 2-isopropylmalate synthase/homocitrate synthase [Chlorobium ferrooxidans DSM 13031]
MSVQSRKIELYDTTLRDGTQGEHINLSVQDKLLIAERLDEFGMDYIEGGWPSSNPKDEEFFIKARKLEFKQAKLCSFGSTARFAKSVETDPNLLGLLQSETPVITIFGKTWQAHSEKSLGISDEENAELIYRSVSFLKSEGREVFFDAEHFFDGYKNNPPFALKMLLSAVQGGASRIVLCDTNGGSLPHEVTEMVRHVLQVTGIPVGIHSHNDGDLAVANTIAALQAGATHVQGTINGIGERCGNANLISIIPNIMLKLEGTSTSVNNLGKLTQLSKFVYEILNMPSNTRAPFVGKSAFAHKGGIHVSAVMKESSLYEHIDPALVGNRQRVLVSELAGQSNIRYKAQELGIAIPEKSDVIKNIVNHVKELEHKGYQFDGAEASFELILQKELGSFKPFFEVVETKVHIESGKDAKNVDQAVLKVMVGGEIEHIAADGDGPVNALDKALRKALIHFYPEIKAIKLIDYKVRVLEEKRGTSAKVRVLIESSNGRNTWGTVGVSTNIIEASLLALQDSMNYHLFTVKAALPAAESPLPQS